MLAFPGTPLLLWISEIAVKKAKNAKMYHYAMVNTLYIVTHCNSKKQSDIFTYAKYKYLITLLIKSHLGLLRYLDCLIKQCYILHFTTGLTLQACMDCKRKSSSQSMYKEISVPCAKRSSNIKCIFKQYCGKLNLPCTYNLGPWLSSLKCENITSHPQHNKRVMLQPAFGFRIKGSNDFKTTIELNLSETSTNVV